METMGEVEPDEVALRDDLTTAAMVLEAPADPGTLSYLTQFLGGIARSVDDQALQEEMDALAKLQETGAAVDAQVSKVAALVQDRIAKTAAI